MTVVSITSYKYLFNEGHLLDTFKADNLESLGMLNKKGKHYTKVKVLEADKTNYFIHFNPMIITPEVVESIKCQTVDHPKSDESFLKMAATLGKHTELTEKRLSRFRFGSKEALEATKENQILLFCKNAHFDTATADDKIWFEDGRIVPITHELVY